MMVNCSRVLNCNKSSILKHMNSTISLALLLFFFPLLALSDQEFIFNGFGETQASPENLELLGSSIMKRSGALRLTDTSQNYKGRAFYRQPLQISSSFSTHFIFAIVPPTSGLGGHGLAFVVAPSTNFRPAGAEHDLGIYGNSMEHIFAVEFDTVTEVEENSDVPRDHVGINTNSMTSIIVEPASYFTHDELKQEIALESGHPIQAWIEYDGPSNVVNVTICPMGQEKPSRPLISNKIDLTNVLNETNYVGFSAATGIQASSHYILGWSFSMNGIAPPLDYSQLPVLSRDPLIERKSSSFKPQIKILIAVLSAVIILSLGLLFSIKIYRRITQFEILEDWEMDCPHRFRYRDLCAATKDFRDSEVIGVGGFGQVYKGKLPITGIEVAVKKICRNSRHGVREFVAEIESLGRLRHKNLVNLRGWCKRKNDLLLVYDYIPNGSLHSLLFNPGENFVLSWEQRFNIIKGIASGLLYLHEDWEQVVIHRDIKSSNVLIDADMNASLGDFGLARLYDHGKVSHTTDVVGTFGYIALEMARTGRASTRSDVYAFGVLLLEVASGRRPVGSDHFILVDWVLEFQQSGQILDVVDPKLGSSYLVEQMELVLGLGLLCSHHIPEARPTMRQVLRYLNGDDLLPLIDWSSVNFQRSEMNSRHLEVISRNNITGYAHLPSCIGGVVSTSSIEAGR